MSEVKARMLYQSCAFDTVRLAGLAVYPASTIVTVEGGTELLSLLAVVGDEDTLIIEMPNISEDPWYLFGDMRLLDMSLSRSDGMELTFQGPRLIRLTKSEFESWADFQEVSGWSVRFPDVVKKETDENVT